MSYHIKDESLQRNGDFGIRTKHTKQSDEAWVAGHKAALPLIFVTELFGIVIGLLTVLVGFLSSSEGVVLVCAGMGYVGLFSLLVVMTRRANHAAQGALNLDGQ
ncbi:SdpI family protein [Timonella sp. A28]|uniref:SdpI family protein n=1 Tax=Timonella sp. A28 TaxID=3442640 RepID=UPI003EB79F78